MLEREEIDRGERREKEGGEERGEGESKKRLHYKLQKKERNFI